MSNINYGWAGTAVNDASIGDVSWTNPENAAGADRDTLATCDLTTGEESQFLVLTNFTWFRDMPATATITGIRLHAEVEDPTTGTTRLAVLRDVRVVVGGAIQPTNMLSEDSFLLASTTQRHGPQLAGGDGSTGGVSLSVSDVEASDFGIAIRTAMASPGTRTTQVRNVRILVYWEDTAECIITAITPTTGEEAPYTFHGHALDSIVGSGTYPEDVYIKWEVTSSPVGWTMEVNEPRRSAGLDSTVDLGTEQFGWNCSFYFDQAGSYTVTATMYRVINGVITQTAATSDISITVNSSTRTVRYVDSATGDNSNDGSQGSPWETLKYAIDNTGNDTEIVVVDGSSFTLGAGEFYDLTNRNNVYVHRDDSGAEGDRPTTLSQESLWSLGGASEITIRGFAATWVNDFNASYIDGGNYQRVTTLDNVAGNVSSYAQINDAGVNELVLFMRNTAITNRYFIFAGGRTSRYFSAFGNDIEASPTTTGEGGFRFTQRRADFAPTTFGFCANMQYNLLTGDQGNNAAWAVARIGWAYSLFMRNQARGKMTFGFQTEGSTDGQMMAICNKFAANQIELGLGDFVANDDFPGPEGSSSLGPRSSSHLAVECNVFNGAVYEVINGGPQTGFEQKLRFNIIRLENAQDNSAILSFNNGGIFHLSKPAFFANIIMIGTGQDWNLSPGSPTVNFAWRFFSGAPAFESVFDSFDYNVYNFGDSDQPIALLDGPGAQVLDGSGNDWNANSIVSNEERNTSLTDVVISNDNGWYPLSETSALTDVPIAQVQGIAFDFQGSEYTNGSSFAIRGATQNDPQIGGSGPAPLINSVNVLSLGNRINVTFDSVMDQTVPDPINGWSLSGFTITSAAWLNSTQLQLSTAEFIFQGDSVPNLVYTASAGNITNSEGTSLADANESVTNSSTLTSDPTTIRSGIVLDGGDIRITMDDPIVQGAGRGGDGGWSVRQNGILISPPDSASVLNATQIFLNYTVGIIEQGATVTLEYDADATSEDVLTLSNNSPVDSFTGFALTNNSTIPPASSPPVISNFTATQNGTDIDVSFNSTANDLTSILVSVSGQETATLTLPDFSEAGGLYSATFTPSAGNGSYVFTLDDAINGNGDGADGSDTDTVVFNVDLNAPVISNVILTNPSAQNVVASFQSNEQVVNIEATIDTTVVTNLTEADFTESGVGPFIYTLATPVDYGQDGTVTFTLDTAEDAAANDGGSGQTAQVIIDTTAPVISNVAIQNPTGFELSASFQSDEQLATIQATIDTSVVTNLTEADFTESGVGPYTYTLTSNVDAVEDGTYTFTLNTAEDAAGNDGGSGQNDQITIDLTAPVISNVDITNPADFQLSVSFESDEQIAVLAATIDTDPVTNLTLADFTESGVGPYVYTLTNNIDAVVAGSYTFTLDTAEDAAGNDGAAGPQDTITLDSQADNINKDVEFDIIEIQNNRASEQILLRNREFLGTANGQAFTVRPIDANLFEVVGQVQARDSVTITLPDPGSDYEIRYTTNMQTPTYNSPVYSEPLVFTSNMTGIDNTVLKFRIFRKNNNAINGKTVRIDIRVTG